MSSSAGVVALRGAIEALRSEPLSGVPGEALAADLIELRRLIDSAEAEWLRRLATFDARGGASEAGAVSTGAWVRSSCRLAPGVARGRVELARALSQRPATAAALGRGELSVGHAQQIVTAVDELARVAGADVAADVEPAVVEVARRVDPARLRRELVRVRAALAPDAAGQAAEVAYGRRRLSVSETFDGMVALDGMLDPEGGALLLSALTPLTGRSGPDDPRTAAQRRADALVEVCRRQLDTGELPEVGGERPHLTVLVDLDTLGQRPAVRPADSVSCRDQADPDPTARGGAAAGRDGTSRAATGRPDTGPPGRRPPDTGPPDRRPPDTGQPDSAEPDTGRPDTGRPDTGRPDMDGPAPTTGPPTDPASDDPTPDRVTADRAAAGGVPFRLPTAETEWAGPICGEAARRIACDAAVSRVIITGPSQPLDVGRRTRTVPPAIRTALVVRDRGCAFPGCDRPPPWTDAHHLEHWADGGPTSLDNLILLCRRHHRAVHEQGWRLTRGPDRRWTVHRRHAIGTGPPAAA